MSIPHIYFTGASPVIELNPKTTALVLIDLQKGILGMPGATPISGEQLLERGKALAERFRAAGALVVLVNVAFAADGSDVLKQPVDQPFVPPPGGLPAGFSDFPAGLQQPGDIHITKRQWGAFYGTDLELQLRRRGIRGIVLGGVSTSIGVESTARDAWERGFELVVAEDLCSSLAAAEHEFSIRHIMPRISRVTSSTAIELE
jgi:nicotinamidase-related amidase